MAQDHEAFWSVVEDCLVFFHGRDRKQARDEVVAFVSRIKSKTRASEFGMIYHEEPFSLACDIADRQLDLADHRAEYLKILREREGNVGVART